MHLQAPSHRLLAFLILNFVIAGIALQSFSVFLYRHNRIPEYCDGTVIHPLHDLVSGYQEMDSWYPMLQALNASSSRKEIYQTVFFEHLTKFQYPLASLIPIGVLRKAVDSDKAALGVLKWLSVVAFSAQIPLVFFILSRSFKKPHHPLLLSALAVILVVSFYPLARAYAAGQVQIFLDLLFSAAFLKWIDKKDAVSGFLLGLCVLVKPQYGLFLVWSALRRNWKFFAAAAVPVLAGNILSVLSYGWRNNLQYLDVIRYMSLHGEGYYPNQSINGLLNRLLHNGDNTTFNPHAFAPFLPVVYWLTLITSVIFVALAIFNKRPQTGSGSIAEFALVGLASTVASPIAWEHHYGILLPVFAWLFASTAGCGRRLAVPALLLIAFVLCADDWRMTNLFANMSPWNILQSTLLCGAIIVFFRLRSMLGQVPPEVTI